MKIKTIEEIYRGYTKTHIHYLLGKRIKKESWYTVHTWPQHPRMDWVRNGVYGALDVLGKGIIKLRNKL